MADSIEGEVLNKGGRPLAFKTPKEMQVVIDEYFDYCDNRLKEIHSKEGDVIAINHPAPYTMSGLARVLGIDRRTLLDYSKRDEFLPTIKTARDRVQEDVERRLMETPNQAGAIFNLKNNFGWKDKTEVENNIIMPKPILGGTTNKTMLEETDDN